MTSIKRSARWTRVFVDERRCVVYGPSWGRFYLVDAPEAFDANFQRVLGLRSCAYADTILDPVQHIAHDRASLREHSGAAPVLLRMLYVVLHWSRYVVPLRWMAQLLAHVAARASPCRRTSADAGRIVFEVERASGREDCYPRALLTLFLSLTAGHCCELFVGCLSPTRKMHAWCSVAGVLPYEALPEHYMYQPVYALSFAP